MSKKININVVYRGDNDGSREGKIGPLDVPLSESGLVADVIRTLAARQDVLSIEVVYE